MIHGLLLAAIVYFDGQRIDATVVESNGAYYVTTTTNAAAVAVPTAPAPVELPPAPVTPPPAPAPSVPPSVPVAPPVTPPAAPVPTPWVEKPAVPPTSTVAAVRGRLTWQENIFTRPPDAGAQVWLLDQSQVALLAKASGGTVDEPIPTGKVLQPATDQYSYTVAAKDGRFGFDNVAPGQYTLILLSRHANGLAARDRQGKMRFKKIDVKPSQTVDASFGFGVTAYKD